VIAWPGSIRTVLILREPSRESCWEMFQQSVKGIEASMSHGILSLISVQHVRKRDALFSASMEESPNPQLSEAIIVQLAQAGDTPYGSESGRRANDVATKSVVTPAIRRRIPRERQLGMT